jgi:hypothetical protein
MISVPHQYTVTVQNTATYACSKAAAALVASCNCVENSEAVASAWSLRRLRGGTSIDSLADSSFYSQVR